MKRKSWKSVESVLMMCIDDRFRRLHPIKIELNLNTHSKLTRACNKEESSMLNSENNTACWRWEGFPVRWITSWLKIQTKLLSSWVVMNACGDSIQVDEETVDDITRICFENSIFYNSEASDNDSLYELNSLRVRQFICAWMKQLLIFARCF